MEYANQDNCAENERIGSPPLDPDGAILREPIARQRAGVRVVSDLPELLPASTDEVGLLRAFLSDEIGAILRGDD